MKFNFDLFMDILWLGTLCGIISSICIHKLKLALPFINSKIVSIFINMIIGFCVSELFTNLGLKESLAVGIITWIGAETILETLSKKNLISQEPNIEQLEELSDDNNDDNEYEEETEEEDN